MITIDNKVFRNLEEQVLKNKDDIESIRQASELLNAFGIKVVGQVDTADELPSPADYPGSYGDAYLVGTTTPYDYYIFTRPNDTHNTAYWLNIGEFPLAGPQGPQGEKGDKGDTGTGSKWYAGDTNPTFQAEVNDQYLNTSDGSVFSYSNVGWTRIGNIRGTQGIQGIQGERGPIGPIGPQGPQGERGDVGGIVNIRGQVSSESQLPTPASLNNLSIAYLVGTEAPYTLYIQVGDDPTTALWQNMGQLNVATYVTVNGQFVNILEMNNYQDKIRFLQLTGTSGTLTSAQINLLRADNSNYLIVDNEIYRLDDLMTSSGYLIYTHVGQTNTKEVFIKTLAIMLTNNSWSIQEKKMLDPTTVSNPNLLINGDFRVNQRGQESYDCQNATTYTVDRWAYIGGTVTPQDNGILITNTRTSNDGYLLQYIENYEKLWGKTITISYKLSNGKVVTATNTLPTSAPTSSQSVITTSVTDNTDARLFYYNTKKLAFTIDIKPAIGTTGVTILWAKMEFSSLATEFSPRPYAEELALCQRYYFKLSPQGEYQAYGTGVCTSTNTIHILIPTPTTMRQTGTVTIVGNLRFYTHDTFTYTGASMTVSNQGKSTNGAYLTFTTGSATLTAGEAVLMRSEAGGYIEFNSDLT